MERDRIDSTRRYGPLVCPRGADVIDTSDLEVATVIDRLAELVRARARDAPAASTGARGARGADGGAAAP